MVSNYRQITEENERQLGLDTASRKTQIYLYSDPTHFIYELLQNADDYGATEVSFELHPNKLTIEHNGQPFTEENVRAITYFGKSTSKEDLVKTGRFGIGFKSVFAFTATPIILSGEEHFQIYSLYRVKEYPYPESLSKKRTRIILPFNHKSEQPDYLEEVISPSKANKMIATRLTSLNMRTLLFTKNIKEIQWKTDTDKGEYLREDTFTQEFRQTTLTDGEKIETYRIYSSPIEWEKETHKPVELALAMDNERGKFIPVDDFLYVLFPTAQETRLRFILNGPFRTNPSRETISDEDEFNRHILHEGALLLKQVLLSLRDEKLLNIDFFSILPNSEDELRPFFTPLYQELIELFRNALLVPTIQDEYTFASSVFRGPKAIRDVIATEELRFFTEQDDVTWAKGTRPNSREEKLLEEIGVQEWDWKNFSTAIRRKFEYNPFANEEEAEQWLNARNDEWMKKLYLLILECIRKHDCETYKFEYASIVRSIVDKKTIHLPGKEVKFPKRGYSYLTHVKKEVLKDKKKEKEEKLHEILRFLGVTEIGETEEIESLLDKYYRDDTIEVSDEKHIEHMRQFIAWYQKERNATLFKRYKIFKGIDGYFHKATDIYLDFPYIDTGLEALFDNINLTLEKEKVLLSPMYDAKNIDGFLEFSKKVGVMDGLVINERNATRIQSNIFKNIGRRTETTIDRDYFVNGLSCELYSLYSGWLIKSSPYYLGKLKLDNQITELSFSVWKTLCMADKKILQAYYLPNDSNRDKAKSDSSYLVKQLRSCKWIPGKDGKFYYPADISKEYLHPDLPYDNSNGWLDAIGFGENIRKQQDEYKKQDALARELGFISKEELDQSKEFMERLKESGMTLQEVTEKLLKQKHQPEFPEEDVLNPERRLSKQKERYEQSAEKHYEERTRKTRVSNTDLNQNTYLRKLYTNEDGEMVCQLCQEEMPFKKRNREYYFEAVEMFNKDWFSKEHEAQYLALCPLCSAKYKEFVKRDEENMEEFWDVLRKTTDETVPLQLGEDKNSVRFVKKHLLDLQVILES